MIKTNSYLPVNNSTNVYFDRRGQSLSFKADSGTDTVQLQQSKTNDNESKMSTAVKWGISFGVLATAATAVLLARKNRYSEVKQLAENIKFKKATTLEEAINFGKQTLGIKSYSGFETKDLEVINWINEGMVNTSNKLKGKLRMPKDIQYVGKDTLGEALAGVVTNGKDKGFFGVNKDIFNNLDKEIKYYIDNLAQGKVIKVHPDKTYSYYNGFSPKDLNSVAKSIIDYNDNKITTFSDKVDLWNKLSNLCRDCHSINNAPLIKIKSLLKKPVIVDALKKSNISTCLEDIEKMTLEEQSKLLTDIVNYCYKNKINITFVTRKTDKFSTIYHEMGHLQDDVVRVLAKDKYDSPDKYPKELTCWLNNDKKMQIASSISEYACHGPGEFIAEAFAEMISGRKISDDAIELYKKLKGPSIPGIC